MYSHARAHELELQDSCRDFKKGLLQFPKTAKYHAGEAGSKLLLHVNLGQSSDPSKARSRRMPTMVTTLACHQRVETICV
jgi:hypothetical protein